MGDLPEYYFRVRENGAAVFRVDAENRQHRLELEQIATANIRNGQIRAHGERVLSESERATIRAWMEGRSAALARREVEDIHRAVDHLNHVTQWAQSKAGEADLEEVTDTLLLAMHDLRTVLVRKKAERLMRADGETLGEDD